MRMATVGIVLLVVGAIALATGALPPGAALAEAARVWPVLLFVAAITVVAELADAAGVFDLAAGAASRLAARLGGGDRTLWLMTVVLATISTIFLSIDTTAILLTPVVVMSARRAGADPLPFAVTTVWIANTGSLLLPVSNLTNLLAHGALGGIPTGEFVALTWLPALAGLVVPLVVIALVFRRRLAGRRDPERAAGDADARGLPPGPPAGLPRDRVLLIVSGVVVVLLLPFLVSGVPVWASASAAALILAAVFAVRRRAELRPRLLPWPLLLFAAGLFAASALAHSLGLTRILAVLAGDGSDAAGRFRLAAAGGVAANLGNNLPAYLALEPAAASPIALVALLIGVNLGALITPWASLATLLWHGRLRSAGVAFPWSRYVLLGLVAAPLTVAAAVGALEATAAMTG